jgi:hypothetical protein
MTGNLNPTKWHEKPPVQTVGTFDNPLTMRFEVEGVEDTISLFMRMGKKDVWMLERFRKLHCKFKFAGEIFKKATVFDLSKFHHFERLDYIYLRYSIKHERNFASFLIDNDIHEIDLKRDDSVLWALIDITNSEF